MAGSDVVRVIAEAVLGGARREHGRADPGVVRSDDTDVVGPRDDPARQLDRRRRTQVAAWRSDGDGAGGERGQQHSVQPHRAGIGGGEPCQRTVGFGEQRIAGRSWRQQSFGRAQHDRDVDVETNGSGEGCCGDAMADPSLPGRYGVEFGFESGSEPVPGDRWAHRVEVPEPVECTGECLIGPVLGFGEALDRVASETLFELVGAPRSPVGPGACGARMSELVAQLVDEGSQRIGCGAPPVAAADRAESPVPVVVASHTGFAADAFPARRGQVLAVGVAQRQVGHHVEQVAPTQTAPVDIEQVEHESRRESFGQRGAGTTVPRDVGGGEVVLDEACVRSLRGPQHSDALERGAGSGGVDDETGGFADLLVGVGGGHDRYWSRRRAVRRAGPVGAHDGIERADELSGVGIGGRIAGELGDDAHVGPLAERPHERDRQPVQFLGEVQHEAPQAGGCLGLDRPGGAGEEIGLVVPLVRQRGADVRADVNGLAPAQRLVAQPGHVGRVGETEFGVEVAQRHDRGGVGGDRTERPGIVGEQGGDREIDHRGGHRRPARCGLCRSGDQFGQPVQRDHVDTDDAALASECSTRHHPAGVGGHCNGDRRQGVGSLGVGDRRGERSEGTLGSDEGRRDRHSDDRREGVSQSWPTIVVCRCDVPHPTTVQRCASPRCGRSPTIR